MRKIPVFTYLIVFIITFAIIAGAVYAGFYINKKRTDSITTDVSKLAIDIFTLETRMDILKESECGTLASSTISTELNSLNSRLDFMEQQLGKNNSEIFRLKRYYALLEIKSYLINQKVSQRCSTKNLSLIFIYRDTDICTNCLEQEYILGALRSSRPDITIYSLDFDNDLSVLGSYIPIQNITGEPPILIVNSKVFQGPKSLDEINNILPIATNSNSKINNK